MANEWKVERRKKERKKALINSVYWLIVGVLLFIAYGYYDKFTFGKPSQLFESNLNKVGVIEEFEFSISGNRGWHYVGIAVNDSIYFHLDGNYTVEYYKGNKFLKKEFITKETITKYYKESVYAGGAKHWSQMPFGKLYDDGEYKVKVTVNDIEKPLQGYNEKVYFYVDRPALRMDSYYSQEELDKQAERYRKEKLLLNLIDANETNKVIIPLRKALDTNNIKKVKEILESDNNISIDTNMIFNRRVLNYASFQNNEKLVQYLIDKGADIHHKDELGLNALAYAIENNATKTAKLLLESGVDVNEVKFVHNYLQHRIKGRYYPRTCLFSPLEYVAGNALIEMTELLLKYNIKEGCRVNPMGGYVPDCDERVSLYNALHPYREVASSGSIRSITKEESEIILKLFKKYNFQMKKRLKSDFLHSKQIGY